jgi:hypothetical protein
MTCAVLYPITFVGNNFRSDKYIANFDRDACRNVRRSPCKMVDKTVCSKWKMKWLTAVNKLPSTHYNHNVHKGSRVLHTEGRTKQF